MAHEESEVRWIDCNIGSRLTMKYLGSFFVEEKPVARFFQLHWPMMDSIKTLAQKWFMLQMKPRAMLFQSQYLSVKVGQHTEDWCKCPVISSNVKIIPNVMPC